MIECDYLIIWMWIAWIWLAHSLKWDVIICEANPFSYKIWESHIPNILHADLDILKLIPKLKKLPSFSIKKWTIFADSKNKKYENLIFTELTDLYAFHAQRSELEKFLVNELDIQYNKELVTDIDLDNSIVFTNKNTYKVKKYILDCSWPRQVIANKIWSTQALKNWWKASAKWWYWDVTNINKKEKKIWDYTLLNHIRDGIWLWQIPLYDKNILSVGVISLEAEISNKEYKDLVYWYKHPYYNSIKFREWSDELSRIYNRVWFSQWSTVSSWKNFILIGDAYSFTDPVFSIGTGTAISEAVFIAKELNNNSFNSKEYDNKCKHVTKIFLNSFKLWYNDEWKNKFNLSLIQKDALQWNILKESFHSFEGTLASYINLVTGLEKIYIGNHQDINNMKYIILYFPSESYSVKNNILIIWYMWLNKNETLTIKEPLIQEFFLSIKESVLSMYDIYWKVKILEDKNQTKVFWYVNKLIKQKIIPTYLNKDN